MAKLIVEIDFPAYTAIQLQEMLSNLKDDGTIYFGHGGNSVWVSQKYLKQFMTGTGIRFSVVGVGR